jgi:hypothetical protein
MAGGFLSNDVAVFQCPSCKQFINTGMSECVHCGAIVDSSLAQEAAGIQSLIAQACNDASYLKIMARSFVALYIASLLPFVGWFAGWGSVFLWFAIPIMAIRWFIKFTNLRTSDPDIPKARRQVVIALVIWVAVTIVRTLILLAVAIPQLIQRQPQ